MNNVTIKNNIIYRKATIEDAYQIEYVAAHSWKETYTGYMPDEYLEERILTIENKVERAQKLLINVDTYYVAEVDKKVVGILYYKKSLDEKYKDYGYLDSIYVLKDYQKIGIGKKLFEIAIKGIINLGYNKMYLDCLKGNNAVNFYKKYGGRTTTTADFPIKDFIVKVEIIEFENIKNILNDFKN